MLQWGKRCFVSAKAIEQWAWVVSLEQFFAGVQSRAQDLPEEQRQEVLNRLELAREFVGTQDPLEFFRAWKTPVERYLPLSMQKDGSKISVMHSLLPL